MIFNGATENSDTFVTWYFPLKQELFVCWIRCEIVPLNFQLKTMHKNVAFYSHKNLVVIFKRLIWRLVYILVQSSNRSARIMSIFQET